MSAGNITVNEGTQSAILTDVAGTVEVGVVKIDTSAAGTYGSLWGGKIAVTDGTISSLPNIPGGTITLTNPTGTTIAVDHGTITNLASGTINSATAVINSATISVLPNTPGGTLGLVTTVTNLTNGSVKVTTGTITTGTIQNVASGTINAATAIVNSATISVLPNIPGGTIDKAVSFGWDGTTNRAISTDASGNQNINLMPLGGVVLAGTLGVGTTATALPASALSSRKSMIVYNEGSITMYLGGSGVTTSTGIPVGTADFSPSFDLGTTILYGICGTTGGTARVLEVS